MKDQQTIKYLITVQTQKKQSLPCKIIIFGIVLTSIFLVSSCKSSGEPSDEQIEQAKKAVSDIRASLYTPADAELLAEKLYYGSNPDLYTHCDAYLHAAPSGPITINYIYDPLRAASPWGTTA